MTMPRLGRMRTSPSSCSLSAASCTGVRLTPSLTASSPAEAWYPGGNTLSRIAVFKAA